MLTDVAGVRVGHWSDAVARTGCTVVLLPAGTVASGEVRGGAPGTREWELLRPERLVRRLDAVVLSGGSAFGLAACDGVMRWCAERGLGQPTVGGPVPIVVGCVLYDLGIGDPDVRPGPAEGYAACVAATAAAHAVGRVGAGAGATVAKWRGPEHAVDGGVGAATVRGPDGIVVSALIACNAWGELRGPATAPGRPVPGAPWEGAPHASFGPSGNTTIGVIATNARLDKVECLLVSQSGHDGLARALDPVHATVDGDALVTAATGAVDVPGPPGPAGLEVIRRMAAEAVESAVRAALAPGPAGPGPAPSGPAPGPQ